MTLRHVEIFAAVCQEGSVTRAAERLHISQPTVSIAIREMEAHYQTKLFDRISHKLCITPFGQTIYDYALRLLNLNADMLAASQSVNKLRIGCGTAIGNLQMTPIIKSFLDLYPNIQVQINSRSPSKLHHQIMNNDLDFVIAEPVDEIPGLRHRAILKYPLVVVCHKDNPLAGIKNIQAEELAQQNLFCREAYSPTRTLVETYFRSHNLILSPLWEGSGLTALMNAVKENIGICFVSLDHLLAYRDPSLIVMDVPDFKAYRYVNLCYHKDKILTSHMQSFLTHYMTQSTANLRKYMDEYLAANPDTPLVDYDLDDSIIATDLL